MNIPEVKGDTSIIPYSININKEIFYPNETLQINGSWLLNRDPEDKAYVQFQIYNNTKFEDIYCVWKSEAFNETGEVFKEVNVSVESMLNINMSFIGIKDLYLTLYFSLIDYPDIIYNNGSLFNKSFKITGKTFFEFEGIEINKNIFYPNESIQINSEWNLDYYNPEVCFAQFQIFNETNYNADSLLWESVKYNDTGQIIKEVLVSLKNLLDINMSFTGSINLYVTLFYHLIDNFDIVSRYCVNKSIMIIGKGSFQFESIEISKKLYYQNETVEIDALWDLSYHEPEISYFQFQIFNNSIPSNQTLIYKSEKYYEKGYKNQSISIPIYNILNDSLDNSINLTLKLTYFLEDLNNIRYNKYITNFSITVNPVPPSSNLNPNNQNIYFNILLPSGIGGGFLVIGLVLYFTKREKKKNAEELVIEF